MFLSKIFLMDILVFFSLSNFPKFQMILHYMTGGESGGTFQFPRSLPDLVDHLNAHAHIFTLNVRNETTTEHCSVNEKQFTLDSEQKKAAREQLRDWSEWSTEFA